MHLLPFTPSRLVTILWIIMLLNMHHVNYILFKWLYFCDEVKGNYIFNRGEVYRQLKMISSEYLGFCCI